MVKGSEFEQTKYQVSLQAEMCLKASGDKNPFMFCLIMTFDGFIEKKVTATQNQTL